MRAVFVPSSRSLSSLALPFCMDQIQHLAMWEYFPVSARPFNLHACPITRYKQHELFVVSENISYSALHFAPVIKFRNSIPCTFTSNSIANITIYTKCLAYILPYTQSALLIYYHIHKVPCLYITIYTKCLAYILPYTQSALLICNLQEIHGQCCVIGYFYCILSYLEGT